MSQYVIVTNVKNAVYVVGQLDGTLADAESKAISIAQERPTVFDLTDGKNVPITSLLVCEVVSIAKATWNFEHSQQAQQQQPQEAA